MNFKTLLNHVKEAIHDDGDLQAWCAVNYTRRHKVYVGLDERDPPGADDCPLVAVYPMGKTAGMELDEMEHYLGVTCVLHDDGEKTTARDFLVESEVVTGLIDFVELVRKAVTALTASGGDLESLDLNVLDIEFDTIEAYPFMNASMEFKFDHEYYQGESDYFD